MRDVSSDIPLSRIKQLSESVQKYNERGKVMSVKSGTQSALSMSIMMRRMNLINKKHRRENDNSMIASPINVLSLDPL
jgi:hypothetical protein